MADVGKRIKELRIAAGLSQAALGGIVGVSQQSVNRWEHNLSLPDLPVAINLAEYFEVSLDYLLDREQDSKRYTHEWTDQDGEPVVLFSKTEHLPTDEEKRALEQEHAYSIKNYEVKAYDIREIVDDRLRELFGVLFDKTFNGGEDKRVNN